MRSGVIVQKLGMTRIFTDAGEHIPVTVLKLDTCQVVGQKTVEKNGYTALQLGVGTAKVNRLTKADRGQFAVAKVEPKRKVVEFRVSPENLVAVGEEIIADHYFAGQYVDVSGTSVGKGFAGAMKRHNFAGQRASHGVKKCHRHLGGTGCSASPSRLFKGKKMAGQYGNAQCTVRNLKVVRVDSDNDLLLVRGAVPGPNGGFVVIKPTNKLPVAAG